MAEGTRKPSGVAAHGARPGDAPASSGPASPGSAPSYPESRPPPGRSDAEADPPDSVDLFDSIMPRAENIRRTMPCWGMSPSPSATRAGASVARPDDSEREGGAPSWLVVMMITSAAACVSIVAYYEVVQPASNAAGTAAGEAGTAPAAPASAALADTREDPSAAPAPTAAPASPAPPTPVRRPRPVSRPPPPGAASSSGQATPVKPASGRLFDVQD